MIPRTETAGDALAATAAIAGRASAAETRAAASSTGKIDYQTLKSHS